MILKTDTLARVRTPAQRKLELLDEFERSEGSVGTKFAALTGIKYSTFAAWVAKRKRAAPVDAVPAKAVESWPKCAWLEAVIDRAQESAGKNPSVLILHFAGGAHAEVANPQQAELAAAVLRSLEGRC